MSCMSISLVCSWDQTKFISCQHDEGRWTTWRLCANSPCCFLSLSSSFIRYSFFFILMSLSCFSFSLSSRTWTHKEENSSLTWWHLFYLQSLFISHSDICDKWNLLFLALVVLLLWHSPVVAAGFSLLLILNRTWGHDNQPELHSLTQQHEKHLHYCHLTAGKTSNNCPEQHFLSFHHILLWRLLLV